jgi:hypothetical protein
LPYFRKIETCVDVRGDDSGDAHGVDGLIYNGCVSGSHAERKYPLREPLRRAWERVSVKSIANMNAGSPVGLGELVEN